MKTAIQFALIVGLLCGIQSCASGHEPNSHSFLYRAKKGSPKVLLPAGTLLKVSLVDPLRSDTSSPGDIFLVSMAEPIVIDGVTALDSQALLWGKVVDSVESGRVKGSAVLQLTLIDITQSESTIPIVTNIFTVGQQVMRSGVTEAAVSSIHRVPFMRENSKAPIGVLTTAAVDSGIILGTGEREIYFGPETRLNFTLLNAVEL